MSQVQSATTGPDNSGELRRDLGFWAALTIGAGTMIGAGIFLLSGLAVSLTGPAAIFSYVAAGVICLITAASAAELATGMPTSGGDYFFVSRSLGPTFGAISGIGIWLSLTFAIAFYLFGLGEYLHAFLPITPLMGAVAGGIIFTSLNVIGAKESGGTQIVVVLTLILILVGFILAGLFHVELANLTPFFPYGSSPVFTTTALIFISFMGFAKISAVSEEIKEPSKNIPRALIGSVALVTILYILIVVVIAGIFPQEEITHIRSPLTVAAEMMFGPVGAGLLIFGGLLATLSSANASIMAASRINLAMSRDKMIPGWLSEIHPKRLTPYRAIIFTGGLALLFLFIDNLETLAEIASVLQLYSYAMLNIGVIVLRVASPAWFKPSFHVPFTPFFQILAALGCLAIIAFSGIVAQIVILILVIVSLAWYFVWGRKRVEIRYGLPLVRERWDRLGWRAFRKPVAVPVPVAVAEVTPVLRRIDAVSPRRVLVALANPQHESDLLQLALYIATGRDAGGSVFGFHVVRVPLQTPLKIAREQFSEIRPSIERTIAALTVQTEARSVVRTEAGICQRSIVQTKMVAVTDVAHDVFGMLMAGTAQYDADLLLLGWQGGFNVSHIYNSPIQRIITHASSDVAVLKNRGLEKLEHILVPWGGGPHAEAGLEIAVRVAESSGADIHVLRIVKTDVDHAVEEKALVESISAIAGDFARVRYHIRQADSIMDGLRVALEREQNDLVIIGASHEWTVRTVLFGTIPDLIADMAPCSVLMVRRRLPENWAIKAAERVKRIKESVGLTSSPENGVQGPV